MNKLFWLAVVITVGAIVPTVSYTQSFSNKYNFERSKSYVKDKNFYLLTLFDKIDIIRDDEVLRSVKTRKFDLLKDAVEKCDANPQCHVKAYEWTDDDIRLVSERLKVLCNDNSQIKSLVEKHLRPSGYFQRYSEMSSADMLAAAWKDAALNMNKIMGTYALGKPGMYPILDSASYDVRTLIYRENINIVSHVMLELPTGLRSFYDQSLSFTLQLLDINMRDEAARFEPVATENAKCLAYLEKIKWDQFRYNAIMIPGAGPDITTAPIDPWAKSRLQIAVDRFKKGLAPVIIVSGGFVKPFQTSYCEGYEMKKYLISEFGIDEKYILLEPYARHTTTNIRNSYRIMYRHSIPVDKLTLVISDMYQTKTMQSEKFRQRCIDELGYQPFVQMNAVSKFETEFKASLTSLHMDANDPLDP